jgi:predicted  nucleic acid-binding Zn-ribbon protein
VWEEQEIIDAIELLPIHLSSRCEVEHLLKADGWFLAFVVTLANEAWPHGVVKFQGRVCHGCSILSEVV